MTGIGRPLPWLWWALILACGSTPSAPDGRNGGQPSTVVLSWNRDGGFAGFCDELKVTASGDVTASSCRTSGAKTRKLPNADLTRLDQWRQTFGPVSITSGDAGSADGMTLKLTLSGKGRDQPSEAQRHELLEWAQRLYNQTNS